MHVGMWGVALVVIVLVSWMMYRYLAPDSWKEWSRAGVLQAFVIAFYAEMYGFPLTIYFLGRFIGVDVAWTEGGNLWAQLAGTPVAHLVAMGLGYALVFVGAEYVVEGWRAVHRAAQQDQLVTDGVYAKMRHPQYTGLFLIVFGEGVVHWPTIVSVFAFPIIVIAYTVLARKEERQMVDRFGDAYRAYRDRVPMFVPRFPLTRAGEV
ncbi:MAG: methyltransferase family protein [Myxococcota bacterium]